jgi:hypothetical protein
LQYRAIMPVILISSVPVELESQVINARKIGYVGGG